MKTIMRTLQCKQERHCSSLAFWLCGSNHHRFAAIGRPSPLHHLACSELLLFADHPRAPVASHTSKSTNQSPATRGALVSRALVHS